MARLRGGSVSIEAPGREGELATTYDGARTRLVSIAYAVLGSHSEAEDVVADCWLRLVDADRREPVRDVEGWATVTVARAALDVARSARRRREVYTGPWLPEPVVALVDGPGGVDGGDPLDRVTLDDSLRYALLVVLESLSPAERTSWVLHDLFGLPFDEIATAVGRTPAAVRQLASRARTHVRAGAPRVEVTPSEHDAAVRRFLAAAAGGDLGALLEALDPDVVLTSDGGGFVSAALRPIVGADKVGRFVAGILSRNAATARVVPIRVNGELGVGVMEDGVLTTATSFTFDGERVVRMDVIRSPEKLPRHPRRTPEVTS
ncbi:RNA polymerase sigma factor SigJ [Nocardioides sp. Kera G14]|uniref:RNA polymerase sigma factor SigJ n=1 Tax=Nocardioides sp. Kera G14 TaxID=2884264 RepID=UPI001D10F24C|nr:RNA polymerase sigma factor SigJ [Nocardioides sp. Kera G14]UDY23537.1 RNA polymerase sigma factor SigJ [Nocardioides sp. Kera G14]